MAWDDSSYFLSGGPRVESKADGFFSFLSYSRIRFPMRMTMGIVGISSDEGGEFSSRTHRDRHVPVALPASLCVGTLPYLAAVGLFRKCAWLGIPWTIIMPNGAAGRGAEYMRMIDAAACEQFHEGRRVSIR